MIASSVAPLEVDVAVVLTGLVVGSFLSTLVLRLPEGRSVVFGRSHCDSCGKRLSLWQLIPLFGWLLQRGRCASCGASISPLYLLMELGAAAIGLWTFLTVPPSVCVWTVMFGWCLFTLAVMDWRSLFLSDILVIPLAIVGLVVAWLIFPATILDHIFGMIGAVVFLYGVGAAYRLVRNRDGLGLGDAKLFGAAGAWLGYAGLPSVLLYAAAAALLAVFIHGTVGVRIAWNSKIAFGSYLCLGTWLVWLYGPLVW